MNDLKLASRKTEIIPATTNTWSYVALLKADVLTEFTWLRDMIIATVIAAVTAGLQIHYRFVEVTQSKLFWIPGAKSTP
jgi:hypothetical protein